MHFFFIIAYFGTEHHIKNGTPERIGFFFFPRITCRIRIQGFSCDSYGGNTSDLSIAYFL